MIVKHIPARPMKRDAIFARVNRARSLIDYMNNPTKQSDEKDYQVAYMLREKIGRADGERLFHIGSRGFVSSDFIGQRAEMIAVANAAQRSPDPIDHWLLSWREGEFPTGEQVDEAVAMFVEHMGMGEQPCIYACHGDTHNRHVHIALNRYDPVQKRMLAINKGLDREAAHQAVALIVDRFGWKAEARARYTVQDGRPILAESARRRREDGQRSIRPQAAAFELRTGYRSAQRIAQEDALPRIAAANSWNQLHEMLAAIGVRYDRRGTNGVILAVGDEPVRASNVDRGITLTRLERRLGSFEERASDVVIAVRAADADRLPDAFRADEFGRENEDWRQVQAARRARKAGSEINSPATDQEVARAAARDRRPQRKPPPNLESWYYARGEGVFAERWRKRSQVEPFPSLSGSSSKSFNSGREIDGYCAFPCSDGLRYATHANAPTAFVDRGARIEVVATEDVALLAALRLAAAKFDGKVSVKGSAAFRERMFQVALANNIASALIDPDFTARWASLSASQKSEVRGHGAAQERLRATLHGRTGRGSSVGPSGRPAAAKSAPAVATSKPTDLPPAEARPGWTEGTGRAARQP